MIGNIWFRLPSAAYDPQRAGTTLAHPQARNLLAQGFDSCTVTRMNWQYQRDAVTAVNALTARWVKTWSGGSVVMAGAGAWPLLAHLASASEGEGRRELQEAVGMDAATASQAAGAVLSIMERSTAIRSALGLWTRPDLPLHPAWTTTLPAGMYGELTSDPAADRLRLDTWAKEQTGGLIPAMPIQLTDRVLLVLAMALTVRTTWLRPFTDGIDLLEAGPWAGREIHVLLRRTHILDRARVADTPAGPLTLLRVMGSGGIDVHLVLGDESMKPGHVLTAGIDVLAGCHPATPAGLLPATSPGPGMTVRHLRDRAPDDVLNVKVPRFTITSTHDLLDLPEVFGLATVTDPSRGHFPGISSRPLAVTQARQNAVATFQATGFEAAATTVFGAVAGGIAPPPPYRVRHIDLHFNHPFGFLTVDRRSHLILTAGWVAEPETWPEEPSS
ncbi:proteinase inhibitor I4 serpin [Nonomuraea phyllanthi]|uniref:Proteinase inhibitor I4 serpin n=2 Tax=Nonomuraea phyllanthi TaxID=2219224 RepID=A0A5C4WR32_9ACTN|nr:proteinase inhibitor I4 serpin [Nonomuraea phyllanthi]